MGLQLSPKKQQGITDIVHNSKNTSAAEARKILNTTFADAGADQMFADLIDNWSDIKAGLEERAREAQEGKELVPIQENAEKFRKIIEFFKDKGGEPDIVPSNLSMETLHVQVKITFRNEFALSRKELDTFSWIMKNTGSMEIYTPNKGKEIKIGFMFRDLGKYVDPAEVR